MVAPRPLERRFDRLSQGEGPKTHDRIGDMEKECALQYSAAGMVRSPQQPIWRWQDTRRGCGGVTSRALPTIALPARKSW